MDTLFTLAVAPRTVHCFGLPLKQLTVGHLFAFLRYCPSVIDSPEDSTIADALTASFICAQDWRHAKDLESRWFKWFSKWWALRTLRLNKETEALKFSAYLREQFTFPEIKTKASDQHGQASYTPFPFRILAMLMVEFHYSKSDALDETMLMARSLWSAQGERDGSLEFWTEDNEALWQAVKAGDAAKFGGAA